MQDGSSCYWDILPSRCPVNETEKCYKKGCISPGLTSLHVPSHIKGTPQQCASLLGCLHHLSISHNCRYSPPPPTTTTIRSWRRDDDDDASWNTLAHGMKTFYSPSAASRWQTLTTLSSKDRLSQIKWAKPITACCRFNLGNKIKDMQIGFRQRIRLQLKNRSLRASHCLKYKMWDWNARVHLGGCHQLPIYAVKHGRCYYSFLIPLHLPAPVTRISLKQTKKC